jgi:hypothetical protein
MNKNIKKTSKSRYLLTLVTAAVLGAGMFMLIKPPLVEALKDPQENLVINSVGTKPNSNGYNQIYVVINNEKIIITDTNYTNASPEFDANYVVWMGQKNNKWQIFMYNIITEHTIQITNQGNNANPKIQKGEVIWEGQTQNTWHIFHFNGLKVENISISKDYAYDAKWDSGYITYTTGDVKGVKKLKYDKTSKTELEFEEALQTSENDFDELENEPENLDKLDSNEEIEKEEKVLENTNGKINTELEKITIKDIEKELNINVETETDVERILNTEQQDIKKLEEEETEIEIDTNNVVEEITEEPESNESTES